MCVFQRLINLIFYIRISTQQELPHEPFRMRRAKNRVLRAGMDSVKAQVGQVERYGGGGVWRGAAPPMHPDIIRFRYEQDNGDLYCT